MYTKRFSSALSIYTFYG